MISAMFLQGNDLFSCSWLQLDIDLDFSLTPFFSFGILLAGRSVCGLATSLDLNIKITCEIKVSL